jgi:hypothetical protein
MIIPRQPWPGISEKTGGFIRYILPLTQSKFVFELFIGKIGTPPEKLPFILGD